jgi:hypothetical protein
MRQTISRSLVSLTVVIAILVLFSPCGFAEDPSAQALSLSDAITSAMSKRAELQAATQVEASSAQLRRQAGIYSQPQALLVHVRPQILRLIGWSCALEQQLRSLGDHSCICAGLGLGSDRAAGSFRVLQPH